MRKQSSEMTFTGQIQNIWSVEGKDGQSLINRPENPFGELEQRIEDNKALEQDIVLELTQVAEEVSTLQDRLDGACLAPVISYIRKRDNKWIVYSKDGKRLGEHNSKESAEKQLKAIETHKHAAAGGWRFVKRLSSPNKRVYQLSRAGATFRKTKVYDDASGSEWLLEANLPSSGGFRNIGAYSSDYAIDDAVKGILSKLESNDSVTALKKQSIKSGDVVALKPEYTKRGYVINFNAFGDAVVNWQDGVQQRVNPELLMIVARRNIQSDNMFKQWLDDERIRSRQEKKKRKKLPPLELNGEEVDPEVLQQKEGCSEPVVQFEDYTDYLEGVEDRIKEVNKEEEQLRDELAAQADQVVDQIDKFLETNETHLARLKRIAASPGEFKDREGTSLDVGDKVVDHALAPPTPGGVEDLYQSHDDDLAMVDVESMRHETPTQNLDKVEGE